jgi:pyridoxal phosphate enzyme (YggS family)
MRFICKNLEIVNAKIIEASLLSNTKNVELVAVTKKVDVEVIREAVEADQQLFGENRVQELLSKQPLLPANLRWHLIGHLQSNKVRKVLPTVEMIHSVDNLDLARDINRIAAELGLYPKVLLEVNVAGESSKFGFAPEKVTAQLEELLELERLEIHGLMCVPPVALDAENSRKYFIMLRELRDDLERRAGAPFPTLSMGMSHDYVVAVQEGATIVRVGSAIFGERS